MTTLQLTETGNYVDLIVCSTVALCRKHTLFFRYRTPHVKHLFRRLLMPLKSLSILIMQIHSI